MSSQALDYILKQHPDRSEVALYLGSKHAEMVDLKREEMPEELHLIDEDMATILGYTDTLRQDMYSTWENF